MFVCIKAKKRKRKEENRVGGGGEVNDETKIVFVTISGQGANNKSKQITSR